MQTFAKATATYVATLLLFWGAVTVWKSFSLPVDPALSVWSAIILLTVIVGLWAAIPTILLGTLFGAMFHIVAMPVRLRAATVSALTAFASMKVSSSYYAEAFQEMGAQDGTSMVEMIVLAILAGLVAFAIWTAFPQENLSDA